MRDELQDARKQCKKRVRKNHQQGVEQKNTKTKNGDKKEKMEVKEKRKKMIQKKDKVTYKRQIGKNR